MTMTTEFEPSGRGLRAALLAFAGSAASGGGYAPEAMIREVGTEDSIWAIAGLVDRSNRAAWTRAVEEECAFPPPAWIEFVARSRAADVTWSTSGTGTTVRLTAVWSDPTQTTIHRRSIEVSVLD